MATRFYLHNDAAPYTPATIRGAWDSYASAVTKRLDSSRLPVSAAANVAVAETSTTDEWDILLYRGVSGPLAAATLGAGTVNVMLPVIESNAAANLHFHLHIYVTQGDSDVVRGTLLADYREGAGVNEWTTTAATCGLALNAAVALASQAVTAGDRLVVEIGYTARNTSATSYTGTLYYGAPVLKPDLVAGGPSTNIGYVEFSETISGTATGRVTQGAVEVMIDFASPAACVSQGAVEVAIDSTPPAARASQGPVEVAIETTDLVRVSQVAAEVARATPVVTRTSQLLVEILQPGAVALSTTQLVAEILDARVRESRLSQLVAELLRPTVVELRQTQLVAELVDARINPIRVSQIVVELLGRALTYAGPPTLTPAVLCGKPDVLAWLEWTVPMRED